MKKQMKKLVIITVLIILLASIAGCVDAGNSVKSEADNQYKTVCDPNALMKPFFCSYPTTPTPIPTNVTPTSTGK
jgi:PBP1b-binding outer membrane lipoprotein LpoB